MWNPIRDWVPLSSIHKFPTEDARDGPGNTLHFTCGGHDDDVRAPDGCVNDCDPPMADPSKIQQDYSTNRRQHIIRRKTLMYRRSKEEKIHSGHIGSLLNWKDPKEIPAEIRFLNALWRTCLEIGRIKVFYDLLG